MTMKLYGFFRSGTSHRLRIALNLKKPAYEQVAVDLRIEQHLSEEFKAINPQQLVPVLDADGDLMIQSPAIIEWLEERYPSPPLLPPDADARAFVRALAAIIGNDELVNTMLDAAIETVVDTNDRPVVHSDRGAHYRWPGWLSRIGGANLTR